MWARLWVVSKKRWMIGLPIGALVMFIVGILFWGGFHTVLELTNTESFCISCHEMKDTVYQEYKTTIHFKNPAGVKASCPDCHVPRPWLYKIRRKIQASNELFHSFLGTIDTPEKFEDHRLELATHVWKVMKDSDSRECKNCHSFEVMDRDKQSKRASKKHDPKRIAERGETCIDCHKGIAHHLPKEE
ncbi:MAG: hypothetical protein COW84_00900 [Gammaproteobacteria bacterium CG22_combo_CG10-13_8_21_14_all_40_8]|nr:MAG: hypothetical protein COW84_00900 [Gammaproteobacteria bacterium CG22_combo_CG10-13_8_21_14_all_40_8]